MDYEVEQKFPVNGFDAIRDRLAGLDVVYGDMVVQWDRYFGHPVRDFDKTDEALRIRSIGTSHCITYKGPRIGTVAKTRRELELPLAAGDDEAHRFVQLLTVLGFRPVADVRKERRTFHVDWAGWHVEGTLDRVDHLGTYVELELVVAPDRVRSAEEAIGSLATHVGLEHPEHRSYLELLIARKAEWAGRDAERGA